MGNGFGQRDMEGEVRQHGAALAENLSFNKPALLGELIPKLYVSPDFPVLSQTEPPLP